MATPATTTSAKAAPKFRHEFKFLASAPAADMAARRLAVAMGRDPNATSGGRYLVTSLYFDDPYDRALREKIEGMCRREKFRIRYYGTAPSRFKLEKKLKINGMCSKQQAPLSLEEARRILVGDFRFLLCRDEPLCTEFYSKLQGRLLRPAATVRYEREAFRYAAGNTRVTVDRSMRSCRGAQGFLDAGVWLPIHEGFSVVEVKYDAFLPAVVSAAVSPLSRLPVACSKYALGRRFE